MVANPTDRPCSIFIVRSSTGYQVVPGTHRTTTGSDVVFCNHARAKVEVRLPSSAFRPDTLTIDIDAQGVTTVSGAPGLYEYQVQERGRGEDGFYAVGASSPRIIVD